MENKRMTALRDLMRKMKWDAMLIPCTDPHGSEYIPEQYKLLAWISGFTGSAGNGLVTQTEAQVWTDSRYFLQAEQNIKDSGFTLQKLKVAHAPEYIEWILDTMKKGSRVAVDASLLSIRLYKLMRDNLASKGIILLAVDPFVKRLRIEKLIEPKTEIIELANGYAGKTRIEKIAELRAEMLTLGCDSHLINTLDDIAWILNLRGSDIAYNPVFLSFLFIGENRCVLFTDHKKVNEVLVARLKADGVELKTIDIVYDFLAHAPINRILIDDRKINVRLWQALPEETEFVFRINPSVLSKSIKNYVEIRNMRETMIKDGLSLVKFYMWLEEHDNTEYTGLSELDIVDKIFEFRNIHESFKGMSFSTIAGYREHAAIPHYSPKPDSNKLLHKKGLLLIDSGGQYLGGTTDITRVVSLGDIHEQEKTDYTAVLKGLIALSSVHFPKGTITSALDVLARRPIWEIHEHYSHGTGHGVGSFLNVHEGPQAFGSGLHAIAGQEMLEGMIITIEPGIYHPGKYGIRIENMVLCTFDTIQGGISFLSFETLTLCPIDTQLLDINKLTRQEINWLNSYHKKVFDLLSPGLNGTEKIWLKIKTKPLKQTEPHLKVQLT